MKEKIIVPWVHHTRPDAVNGLASLLEERNIIPVLLPNAYAALAEIGKFVRYNVAIASLRLSSGCEPNDKNKHDPVIENIMHHYEGDESPRENGLHYLCGIGVYMINHMLRWVDNVIVVTSHSLTEDNFFPDARKRLIGMGVKDVLHTHEVSIGELTDMIVKYSGRTWR